MLAGLAFLGVGFNPSFGMWSGGGIRCLATGWALLMGAEIDTWQGRRRPYLALALPLLVFVIMVLFPGDPNPWALDAVGLGTFLAFLWASYRSPRPAWSVLVLVSITAGGIWWASGTVAWAVWKPGNFMFVDPRLFKPSMLMWLLSLGGVLWYLYDAVQVWRGKDLNRRAVWIRFVVLVAVAICHREIYLAAVKAPVLDEYMLNEHACVLFSQGVDPYGGSSYPYPPGATLPEGLSEEVLHVYGYPPGTILLHFPAWLLTGDLRQIYVLLDVLVVGGMLFVARAWRCPVLQLSWIHLGLLSYLNLPLWAGILTRGYNEPANILALVLFACLWTWGRPALAWFLLGLGVATKQPAAVYGLAALRLPGFRWSQPLFAVAAIALLVVPFWAWNPHGFVRSFTVGYGAAPRIYTLSLSSWLWRLGLPLIPTAVGLLLVVLASVLIVAIGERTMAGLFRSSALILWLAFMLAKWANFNYYWLVEATLTLALTLAWPAGGAAGPVEADAPS
jgi:hypothetical protein